MCERGSLVMVVCVLSTGLPVSIGLRLVFSLDQGFGNGVVEQLEHGGDAALAAMASTLLAALPGHQPIALLNPMLKNTSRFEAALQILVMNCW